MPDESIGFSAQRPAAGPDAAIGFFAQRPVTTIPTVTIVGAPTDKRDLGFFFSGTASGGVLSNFSFQLTVECDGVEFDVYPMDTPDGMGRVQMKGVDLPRAKGTIVVSGLYKGWNTDLQRRFNIDPFVFGRCVYSLNVHGKLLFNVNAIVIVGGSTGEAQADAATTSDFTYGFTGTAGFAPGGIGGSASTTVTQPGNSATRTRTGSETTNVTSVKELNLAQIATPK